MEHLYLVHSGSTISKKSEHLFPGSSLFSGSRRQGCIQRTVAEIGFLLEKCSK